MVNHEQPNNPLHGVKLAQIVEKLVDHYGWAKLASRIDINCFKNDPSVKSSLKFLRREQWARDQVEALYLQTFHRTGRDSGPSGSSLAKLRRTKDGAA